MPCNWIKVKSSTVFHIEFCTVVQNDFGKDMCHNKTVLDGLNLLVSVLKFGIASYRFKKAGIAHP